MSSLSPPHKRRRLPPSATSAALSKPFKSPLKAPLQPAAPNKLSTPATSPPQIKSHPLKQTTTTSLENTSQATSSSSSTTPSDPATYIAFLQKRTAALQTSLSAARNQLETSTQALQIERSAAKDDQLRDLIQKWKGASRAAAEEVFKGAKDKVNRMGGVGALKEREKEKRQRDMEGGGAWGWQDEEKRDDCSEDGHSRRLEEGDLGEGDAERRDREDEDAEDDVDEEGGYTMDMMLKTLNIDLEVIGFDREAQRWID